MEYEGTTERGRRTAETIGTVAGVLLLYVAPAAVIVYLLVRWLN